MAVLPLRSKETVPTAKHANEKAEEEAVVAAWVNHLSCWGTGLNWGFDHKAMMAAAE